MKKIFVSVLLFLSVFINPLYGHMLYDKILERMRSQSSLLCVGLDPDHTKFPHEITSLEYSEEKQALLFLQEVIDLTHEHVCAYKIQKAFFDVYKDGYALLHNVVQYIRERDPAIPIIIDCKIGDTDNTMQAYMKTFFSLHEADAILINPYMGDDVFKPFIEDPTKGAVVLIQTSNPDAKIVQELQLKTGEFLWQKMLTLLLERWNVHNNLIPILSSNSSECDFSAIRKIIPQEMPILLAGIGVQGGDISILSTLLNDERIGVFINSSRGILYPYEREAPDWRECIFAETIRLKRKIGEIQYGK